MEIIKVVLFLSAVVSPAHLLRNSDRRVVDSPTSNNENCMCLPSNLALSSVPDILDPRDNGLQRLVVYIYRDVKTNEIKMYTPNAQKQNMIPDLTFEEGDGLKSIDQDFANKIFIFNPNIIVRHRLKKNIRPQPVTPPFNLNIGNIEEVYNEHSPSIPNVFAESINIPLKYPRLNPIGNVISNVRPGINTEEVQSNVPFPRTPGYGDISGENFNNIWDSAGKPPYFDMSAHSPYDFYHFASMYNLMQNKKHGPVHMYRPGVDNERISANGKNKYLTFDKWFTQQMRRFPYANQPDDINSIDVSNLRSLVQETLLENNMYVSPGGILTDSVGTALDVNNLELRPVFLGNPMEYPKVLPGARGKLKLPKDLPYLEGILVTLVYPPKVLGLIPLGKTYISPAYLMDIKLADINIPEKMISDMIDMNKNKIKTSKHKTMTMPNFNYNDISPGAGQVGMFVKETVSKRPIIKHEFLPPKMKNFEKKSDVGENKLKLNAKPVMGNNPMETMMGGHLTVAPIKSMMHNLPMNAADKNKVNAGHGSGINSLANTERTSISDEVLDNWYEIFNRQPEFIYDLGEDQDAYNYFEEIPDFRIIGGNAATSSGAPVSNKGRSGFDKK